MDEVLVQRTKSRRIRMVERKTRKISVDKPKTKHLEARHTMDRKEKKKRSVTLIRDHSKEYLSNLTVEFDQFGRAIGPNRFKFTSYRGVTTRKMISILIDSWDLVDQCDKDQLWLNIKNYWHIRDDNHKAQVLRDCNTQWKAYKSALLKLWEKGVNPVKEYPYLDKAMWKKFIVLKSTEEFEELRRKGREAANKNKNHPRLGPSGYRGNESKWDEEATSGVTIKGHNISSKRARNFLYARRKRNASGQLVITPETEPLADKIIQKDILISQGVLELGPRSDLLAEVLGREHSGRTRAVGHNIGLKQSMIYKRKKKEHELPDVEQMQEKLETRMLNSNFYDKIKDRLMTEMSEQLVPIVVAALKKDKTIDMAEDTNFSRVKTTSVGSKTSTTLLDDLHKITEATDCELMLPYGTVRPSLAKGTVFPFGDGVIHSVPLEAGHLRVSVDIIYGDHHSFLLPISPIEGVYNLGQALHSFIQWPRDSITLIKKDKRPLIEPLSMSTQAAPILHDQEKEKENVNVEEAKEQKKKAKKKQEYEKNLPRKKRRKLEASKEMMGDEAENRVQKEKLYKTMQEPMMPKKLFKSHNIPESFPIVSEPGIFNAASVETVISSVAIMEMLNKEQLDISCILWYQIMLHSLMLVSRMDNKCGFINPQCITSTRCEYDDRGETDHVINDLVDMMNFHEEKQFFLAPYWERRHWMLIVICPHQYKSYILDSARQTKTLKDYTIVEHVNKAVTRFKKTKTNKSRLCPMTWIFPKCNQQLSDWECGYYVMNWMHEFVLFRQHGFPKNIWKDKKPFSSEELEERVKTWMRTFGDKVKPFCKAYNESTTKGKERLEVTKGKERD
ncbi:uncharacterized protein LOC111917613 isoform X2 [Lactuca sativa]|uniref:uncharacterized protein LOC111917613 isoform X2 n=2 Tax=Lactuca sativa TaxID=4236 RepID=UPI0022AF52B4|nr:uncharacterized protein LOC111917613 isoform X2 [Lactuca sativa]